LHDHERIIGTLNDEMANRASGQIKLNETRDNLRETNQTVRQTIYKIKIAKLKKKSEIFLRFSRWKTKLWL